MLAKVNILTINRFVIYEDVVGCLFYTLCALFPSPAYTQLYSITHNKKKQLTTTPIQFLGLLCACFFSMNMSPKTKRCFFLFVRLFNLFGFGYAVN